MLETLSPRGRISVFSYTRESRDEMYSFNFSRYFKTTEANEHKNANEKAGLKKRNDDQFGS